MGHLGDWKSVGVGRKKSLQVAAPPLTWIIWPLM
jgi:hypothetical protein